MASEKKQESTYVEKDISDWLEESASNLSQSKSALMAKILREVHKDQEGDQVETWNFSVKIETET